ncbi:phage/plasmid primase, P4 family [Clostridium tertium]|uniref:DNA primase family protein n=1 Tax=Clostridium tertium TaxID=1559 RepID=UPI001FADFA9C|nr:phage/plasmid primase, P4 family [Clostridium tertium]MDB1949627.1 phage/plasmid primase, P4 family [Clostridium tertium]
MNIKLTGEEEVIFQYNNENNNYKKIMKKHNELTKDERKLIESGSLFYGEDTTKNNNYKKIMKKHNELTKDERKLIESGSLFYGEDTTKNNNYKNIMEKHNELIKDERKLIESESLFYGEDTTKNNNYKNIMEKHNELIKDERKLIESESLFYGEDTTKNNNYNNDLKNYDKLKKEEKLVELRSLFCREVNTKNNKVITGNNSMLKLPKTPIVNTEILKEYVFRYYKFIYCDELRCYDTEKGYYKALTYHETIVMINSIIPEEIRPYLKVRDLNETYKSIKYDHRIQLKRNDNAINGYINCLNGVINLQNVKNNNYFNIDSHSSEYYFLNYVNANYLKNYSIEQTDFYRFIFTVAEGNLELIKLIKQILGYIVSNFNNAKKAFILYGKSNSGKSVFLDLISTLCGEENISNIELQNLSIEKYTAELFGKLVNICSELPDGEIKDTGIFKALVSETDKVMARKVYGQPFSFYNKAKLIFATNNLPEIKGLSYKDNSAFFNRLIIVPFMVSIPDKQQDKDLIIKLRMEKDIIFSWAIEGLVEYIKNGFVFDEPEISKDIVENYRNNDNSITAFLNNKCKIEENSYVHMDKLFREYVKYCEELCYDVPTNKDKKKIKSLIIEKYNLTYRKLNRPEGNKYGFIGLKLIDDI